MHFRSSVKTSMIAPWLLTTWTWRVKLQTTDQKRHSLSAKSAWCVATKDCNECNEGLPLRIGSLRSENLHKLPTEHYDSFQIGVGQKRHTATCIVILTQCVQQHVLWSCSQKRRTSHHYPDIKRLLSGKTKSSLSAIVTHVLANAKCNSACGDCLHVKKVQAFSCKQAGSTWRWTKQPTTAT